MEIIGEINAEILSPLHACSKDETRQHLQRLYFNKGRVLATDGHIMVSIESNLEPSIKFSISFEMAQMLKRTKASIIVARNDSDKEGVVLLLKNGIQLNITKEEIEAYKLPNMESMVPEPGTEKPLDAVRFNPYLVNRLTKALAIPNARARMEFTFYGEASPIMVKPSADSKDFGLLMPMRK